jgi:hypothetical protein
MCRMPIVAVLPFILCTVAWAQTPLFEDPFVDLSHWNAGPDWSAKDGVLTVLGGDIRTCKVGTDWRNYALEFDVTIGGAMCQWVVRAADERTCLFIQLTTDQCPYSPSSLRYHRWRDGKLVDIRQDALPFIVKVGQSYHVRFEVVGSVAQTVIDGKVWGTWSFGPGYESGTVGFRSGGNEPAQFRNLKVVPCGGFTANTARRKVRPKVVQHDPFLNPPFRAEWIWGPGESLDRALRQSLTLAAPALDAHLWITCDNAYKLSVNGKPVGEGNAWQNPRVYDLTSFLRVGENVLSVAGHNDGPGAAGVLAEGNILLADGSNVELKSDRTWRTTDAPAAGWEQPGFDASGWMQATSSGVHPQEPWASQSDWTLPYLGPQEQAQALEMSLPGPLSGGTPLTATLRCTAPKAFSQEHPARVLLTLPGGDEMTVAEGYIGTQGKLTAGENSLQITLPMKPEVWLPSGEYSARVELVGVFFGASAGRLRTKVAWTAPPHPEPLPLSQRPMGPGLFTDQFGGRHTYSIEGDWLIYDGQRLSPIAHGGGAYWVVDDPAQRAAIDACRSAQILEDVRRFGLTEEPVRVRLVDSIQCADAASEASHEFSEDDGFGGTTRLLKIGDVTYRVSDNRRKLSYFAYTMRCQAASKPHLLVFETPNDRERYTLIRIQPPWRNVGCGPYTGRDMACDGKPYQAGFIFYPEATEVRLTVSRLPCELQIDPESGAAVSRLWLFDFADNLSARRCEVAPNAGPTRRIGLSLTHAAYLYDLYGYKYGNLTRRLASLNAFADYAEFAGLNLLEFNAVNGADTSEVAYFPTAIWKQYNGDCNLPAEFLPIAQSRGIATLPCLTSLAFDIERMTGASWISPLTFQIDRDGVRRRDFFRGRGNDNTLPDPLRPEVQKVFLDTLREMAESCRDSPAVTGLAFRMNGKIGTCYVGYNEDERGETAGFSPWDLAQFQGDTGVRIPGWDDSLTDKWLAAWRAKRTDDPAIQFIPGAYWWLRENAWEQWTGWRCAKMADLIRRARDLVRSYRPDWNLVIKCDMPSETPDRNILWPAGVKPLDLLREHGLDPRLLADEPGIILQQGYFIGGGEYFHHSIGSAYFKNPEAWAAFDYQPGLAELYRTPAGTSVEFYHNYWEEFGVARLGEFGTEFWGAGMMYPRGREFFRPLLHSLTTNNVQSMALFSWERGSEGHEGELRRFSRAFRALPVAQPKDFGGKVEVLSGPAADETLWIRQVGARVAVVNESATPRTVRLTLADVPAGRSVYDYATQRRVASPDGAGLATLTLELDAFDLRVIGSE